MSIFDLNTSTQHGMGKKHWFTTCLKPKYFIPLYWINCPIMSCFKQEFFNKLWIDRSEQSFRPFFISSINQNLKLRIKLASQRSNLATETYQPFPLLNILRSVVDTHIVRNRIFLICALLDTFYHQKLVLVQSRAFCVFFHVRRNLSTETIHSILP